MAKAAARILTRASVSAAMIASVIGGILGGDGGALFHDGVEFGDAPRFAPAMRPAEPGSGQITTPNMSLALGHDRLGFGALVKGDFRRHLVGGIEQGIGLRQLIVIGGDDGLVLRRCACVESSAGKYPAP